MATQDWPTSRAFQPAAVQFGSTTGKSAWRGVFTGNSEVTSHLADRLTMTLTLGSAVTREDAEDRAAFLQALDSTGDWVRMRPAHRQGNRGTLISAAGLSAAAASGARSITLTGVRDAVNMLLYPLALQASAWTPALNAAAVTTNQNDPPGVGGVSGDVLTDSSTSASQVRQQVVPIQSSSATYAITAFVKRTTGGTAPTFALQVDLTGGTSVTGRAVVNTDSGALLAQVGTAAVASVSGGDGTYTRVTVTITDNNSGNTAATVTIYPAWAAAGNAANSVAATGAAGVGPVQMELGSSFSAFDYRHTLESGDALSFGGNLLLVGMGGAVATAGGVMTVPLVLPLQKPLTTSDVPELLAPTGVWELATDGISLDYSRGNVQKGIALPFRQVIL